ncbi:MAG: hypothetical protein EOM25_05750 [Deltaproteobacteria bacterium]|nr:hypothetical protein [Deltaproteobacteria bacterium]
MCIRPDMTVLEVVSAHRAAESVFARYNEPAGVCICCQALFEPLSIVAEHYGLDLVALLADLETAARTEAAPIGEKP